MGKKVLDSSFVVAKDMYRQIVILKEKRKRTVSLSGLVVFMLS